MNVSKLSMLNFGSSFKAPDLRESKKQESIATTNPVVDMVSNRELSLALRAMNRIPLSSALSFTGTKDINEGNFIEMVACLDPDDKKVQGEFVGSRMPIHDYFKQYAPLYKNAAAPFAPLHQKFKVLEQYWSTDFTPNNDRTFNLTFTQIDPLETVNGRVVKFAPSDKAISIDMSANPKDKVSVMQIKDKLTPIIRMKDDVIMVAGGTIERRAGKGEPLAIINDAGSSKFKPFNVDVASVPKIQKYPVSMQKAGKVIVGLQEGRYCKELVNSLLEFKEKVDSGKIPIPTFVPAKNAHNMNVLMLAGGFGSRAEYTNATSNSIYMSDGGQANNTKGSFVTPSGLTPMETSLVTLHKAGLFNCTNFEVGTDLMFYLNPKNAPNRGNGGFTLDMFSSFPGEQGKSQFILPNDSVSRMTKATVELTDIMSEGKTALGMISKKVPSDIARGTFGIMMRDSETGEIKEFSEKPKVIPEGFEIIDTDENGEEQKMCLSNTFQFAVSPQAIAALKLLNPELTTPASAKESRDWSSQYVPTLMVLSQYDKPEDMVANLQRVAGKIAEGDKFNNFLKGVDPKKLLEARELLRDKNGEIQKVVSIPTDELWYDVGQLNELYNSTKEIATDNENKLDLLPFERQNVVSSVNPTTGLIASTASELEKIESEFEIGGRVFVAPKAKYVDPEIMNNCPFVTNATLTA